MENAEKIINKIKSQEIKPVPRYQFLLRKIAIWSGFLFFIAIGAISFSVILYTIQQSSFDLLNHLNHSGLEFFLVLFPIVWLLSLLVFLLASMWIIKKSRKGYKWSTGKWLGYSTAFSIVLGTLFFISGGANWFENSFANQVEVYQSIEEKKIKIWSMPDKGNLSGIIDSFSKDTLYIRDLKQNSWKINMADAFIAPMVIMDKGEQIKINGKILDENVFKATDIRPWGGKNFGKFNKSERNGKGRRKRE